MPATKLQDYAAVTPATGDQFFGVDASDTGSNPAGKAKRFLWDDMIAAILALARDSRVTVTNSSGATIAKGNPVAFGGFNATTGQPNVILADADGTGTMPVIGVAVDDIANTGSGDIVLDGLVVGTSGFPLNTSAFAEGDVLYVSTTAGGLVTSPPAGTWSQQVATVLRSHATLGLLLVRVRAPGKAIATLPARAAVTGAELMATDNDEKLSVDQITAYVRGKQPYIGDSTTARTFGLSDMGQHIGFSNSGAITATIPTNASVAFPVGTVIALSADGTGTVTIQGASGITLNGVSANGSTTGKTTVSTAWRGVVLLEKTGTDAWAARGDCAAVS